MWRRAQVTANVGTIMSCHSVKMKPVAGGKGRREHQDGWKKNYYFSEAVYYCYAYAGIPVV